MANLTTLEKQILEKLFQMNGGYVLNFSDRTMGEFFRDDIGIDIYNKKYNKAWLIDIGDFDKIMSELSKDVDVSGVFITHYHHDHIFGINSLIQAFPNCNVYISENGVEGLYSDKVNLSYYYDEPIIFKGSEVNILRNCDRVLLFEDCFLEAISTPGHNWSCMTYKMNNYLFTGVELLT